MSENRIRTNNLVTRQTVLRAVANLEAGKGKGLLAAAHTGASETCVAALARTGDSNTARSTDWQLGATAATAIKNLRSGFGWAVDQSDHSGSETCTETIVRLGSA